MRCRKIQELIKTDYLDAQVNRRQERNIKEHLARCPKCRKLEQELQSQRLLFQKTEQPAVPERIWQNIREAILTERLNQESRVSLGILERLRDSLFAPRPVFILASAITAIIFIAVFVGTVIHKRQSISEINDAESFAVYSINGEDRNLLYELGTDIEEYFL